MLSPITKTALSSLPPLPQEEDEYNDIEDLDEGTYQVEGDIPEGLESGSYEVDGVSSGSPPAEGEEVPQEPVEVPQEGEEVPQEEGEEVPEEAMPEEEVPAEEVPQEEEEIPAEEAPMEEEMPMEEGQEMPQEEMAPEEEMPMEEGAPMEGEEMPAEGSEEMPPQEGQQEMQEGGPMDGGSPSSLPHPEEINQMLEPPADIQSMRAGSTSTQVKTNPDGSAMDRVQPEDDPNTYDQPKVMTGANLSEISGLEDKKLSEGNDQYGQPLKQPIGEKIAQMMQKSEQLTKFASYNLTRS